MYTPISRAKKILSPACVDHLIKVYGIARGVTQDPSLPENYKFFLQNNRDFLQVYVRGIMPGGRATVESILKTSGETDTRIAIEGFIDNPTHLPSTLYPTKITMKDYTVVLECPDIHLFDFE